MCKDSNDSVARQPNLSTLVSRAGPSQLKVDRFITAVGGRAGAACWVSFLCRRVKRFGGRATESYESLHIRIPLRFCQNSGKVLTIIFFRNKFQIISILKILWLLNISRVLNVQRHSEKTIIKIGGNFYENSWKWWFFRNSSKVHNKFESLRIF